MAYTEDYWSRDSAGAEEAARALWEDEHGPDLYVEFTDYEDDFYPYGIPASLVDDDWGRST